jgi:hypothetical protein
MRTLPHRFSNRTRRVALALFVAGAALAATGIFSAGCETDDSSTPLPPAAKDATTDQGSSDGAAPQPESSTPEASTEGAVAEGGILDGAGGATD